MCLCSLDYNTVSNITERRTSSAGFQSQMPRNPLEVWSFGALLKFFILPLLVMHATLSTTSKEAGGLFGRFFNAGRWGLWGIKVGSAWLVLGVFVGG